MIRIGKIIKTFRLAQSLSLKELAEKVELSSSYLSQIENDQVNINLSLLENISNVLNVPVYTFFMQEGLKDINFIKKSERNVIVRKDKTVAELLTDNNVVKFNIQIITYPVGYKAPEYFIHQGEKFCYVLEGSIIIDFSGAEIIVMEEGDCVAFSSSIPHKIISEKGGKILVNYSSLPITYI